MSLDDDERRRLAEAVRRACLEAAEAAYEQGGFSGLCAQGRWELALDAMRSTPLDTIVTPSSSTARKPD
ncbi:hypothetical protein ENSA5_05250 [Enhygromyxa salina]|uniref:Acetyltransferase n=1 Tax=Enhygromyxa salina TaxID=215803 RepID=A0A2S9YI57_9BACT|nr:acetyltransferase [Enhygromyxa salina]PRQ04760.1 hypothetical protein ENSA5_05250 [Enhygromyxa salina]